MRFQLGRDGQLAEPKTPQAIRDVSLPPFVVKLLAGHKLASPFSQPSNFVFGSETGGPMHYRNLTRRGFEKGLRAAGLDGERKPRWHDLRHTFASILISEGLPVTYVSRQMGHASATTTLSAHLWSASEHAERASAALESSFGALIAAT